jgi:hypothetical protein
MRIGSNVSSLDALTLGAALYENLDVAYVSSFLQESVQKHLTERDSVETVLIISLLCIVPFLFCFLLFWLLASQCKDCRVYTRVKSFSTPQSKPFSTPQSVHTPRYEDDIACELDQHSEATVVTSDDEHTQTAFAHLPPEICVKIAGVVTAKRPAGYEMDV